MTDHEARTGDKTMHDEAERPALVGGEDARDLIASLQSMRDRMMPVLADKFGEAFDGDMDTLLDAVRYLKRLKRTLPTPNAIRGDKGAEAVQAEVVGKVRQRRGVHGDFDGFEVDWLLEGGIHAVGVDGDTYLYVLDIPVPEDGHVELFAPTQAAAKDTP